MTLHIEIQFRRWPFVRVWRSRHSVLDAIASQQQRINAKQPRDRNGRYVRNHAQAS